MLSLYRTSALAAPLKAGVRPIASSAVLMAKKKEVGELFIPILTSRERWRRVLGSLPYHQGPVIKESCMEIERRDP